MRPLSKEMGVELAQAIANLTLDEDAQARYEFLADRRNLGTISPLEMEELESLVRANTLLSLLKLNAHSVLEETKLA